MNWLSVIFVSISNLGGNGRRRERWIATMMKEGETSSLRTTTYVPGPFRHIEKRKKGDFFRLIFGRFF